MGSLSLDSSINQIIVGIIGTSSFYTPEDAEQLMETVTDLWGLAPGAKIIFPQGGTLSMYIDLWADKHGLEPIPL